MKTTSEPVRRAALLIFAYAVVISLTDNFVPLISGEIGVWQFHLMRSAMVVAVLSVLARPLRLNLRPRRWGPVVARSGFMGAAIMIYFGALGFLPVATAAAGLFTAPIFVLLISRFVYGQRFGWVRMVAVAGGFSGVAMVLGPEAASGASLAALWPVMSGFLYGIAIVATRGWCEGESTEVLTLGFFLGLAMFGVLGMLLLSAVPMAAVDGSTSFVTRGWVWPSRWVLGWTLVQNGADRGGGGFDRPAQPSGLVVNGLTPMPAAKRDITFVAANLHLIAVFQCAPVGAFAHHHCRLFATVADGANLAHLVGPGQQSC
mgnify:CR=1 FL=1